MQAVAHQNGRTNISRLSVATGMTRKEVAVLLSDSEKSGGATARKSGQQRALRVLSGWMTDPRFRNRRGRPDELTYGGQKKSFASLVKLYAGDVTPKAVLRELERIEAVDITDAGTLRLHAPRGRKSIEVHYQLSGLARLFEDFASAITRSGLKSEDCSFFAFKDYTVPTEGDAAYFMRRFSGRATALLEDFEQWSAGREPNTDAPNRERVAFGVYLLRSHRPSATHAGESSSVRVGVRRGRKGVRRSRY
jgi:Family of unknown function (DUF6502)